MTDEQLIDVAGTQTRVLSAGNGTKSVVFLHGVGARADRWVSTMDGLANEGVRTYALDFPGHGHADKGPLAVSVVGLAAFVNSAFNVLGIERALVVGTSLGGHVAARFFLDHRRRVEGLVLVGSLGLTMIGAERTSGIAERMVRLDRDSIRAKLHHAVYDPATITEQWVDEEHAINNSPGAAESLGSYARYFRDQIDNDSLGEELMMEAAGSPLLLVWGEADRTVPLAAAEDFVAHCPTARLQVIPAAAHVPYVEQPSAFGSALRSML